MNITPPTGQRVRVVSCLYGQFTGDLGTVVNEPGVIARSAEVLDLDLDGTVWVHLDGQDPSAVAIGFAGDDELEIITSTATQTGHTAYTPQAPLATGSVLTGRDDDAGLPVPGDDPSQRDAYDRWASGGEHRNLHSTGLCAACGDPDHRPATYRGGHLYTLAMNTRN